ncbi:GNAT family N-acetyltransferase [Azotobacter beijerinckii]|uniref:GNAT family N-acetyltransferase n=1 Tax=Azotobacter beijerinckii TaxID=170623 RepID=UPI002953F631|nr:GNAT family N-acetyltransferase [Azotobacter beijerinckii]MDV7212389.1 GNAT family N-acetyltransferase [Azotobacter beijerinckii]
MTPRKVFDLDATAPFYGGYRIVLARSPEAIGPCLEGWEALAREAAEPNVFYSPWALLPALEHLVGDKRFTLLFLVRQGGAEEGPVLDGFFPLFEPSGCGLLPRTVARMFRHRYCFSVTPLVRGGREPAVMRAFLRWLHAHRRQYPLLLLRDAPADGPLAAALRTALAKEGLRCHEGARRSRALIEPGDDAERYLERAVSAKRRKEYRRLGRRLAELGDLRLRVLQPRGEDLQAWLSAFLALESKGWKGESRSALGCRMACRRYFEAVATAAYARGQLMMLELSLDRRPLAMLCDFLAPPGAFSFKVAFDEDYAQYSPGALLELECIRLLHALKDQGVQWMDSCAAPEGGLSNSLWLERKPLCTFVLSSGSPLADLWIDLYPYGKRLKGWWKRRQERLSDGWLGGSRTAGG